MPKSKVIFILILVIVLLIFFTVFSIYFSNRDREISGLQGKLVYCISNGIYILKFPSMQKERIYKISKDEHVSGVSWSPDGKRIIFSKRDYNNSGFAKLYIINSEGTELKIFLEIEGKGCEAPSWSPDGEQIAFATQYGDMRDLYIADLNSPNNPKHIFSEVGTNFSWSADSSRIVFAKSMKMTKGTKTWYDREIYVANLNEGTFKKLYEGTSPSWSPNGREIVYLGNDGVYLMNPDGEDNHKIGFSEKGINHLTWSPDSKYILYNIYVPDIGSFRQGFHILSTENPEKEIRFGIFWQPPYDISWSK